MIHRGGRVVLYAITAYCILDFRFFFLKSSSMTWLSRSLLPHSVSNNLQQSATHCNTLQQTTTHCNTLQHTATPCLQRLSVAPFRQNKTTEVEIEASDSIPNATGFIYMNGVATIKNSFAEYSLFYRTLLHKRPIILRSLLIVANP